MVKDENEVREKMLDRVSNAGKYLEQGMNAAEDPLDVLTRDMAKSKEKYEKGLTESLRRGSWEAGIRKAKDNDSWKKSKGRAAAHFEDRKEDMVDNAMKDYGARAAVIEQAQKAIEDMPKSTRKERMARSMKYQEVSGAGYDKLYNRKG